MEGSQPSVRSPLTPEPALRCLPAVEAMAMGLPVIVSNYSGPTGYLTEDNSFPLETDAAGEPSVPTLYPEP